MQAYIDFCQQHNLLLFFDLQLGTEPVKDAVMNHVLTYLEKYPFVELALDTEFHFPNNSVRVCRCRWISLLPWLDECQRNQLGGE